MAKGKIKDDDLLLGQIQDKIEQTSSNYMIAVTGFLDMHQRKVTMDYCRKVKVPEALSARNQQNVRVLYYGGCEDAERCLAVFVPDYVDLTDGVPEEIRDLLRIIRVKSPKGSRKLTHRDYLGSILALGITREVVGDIFVGDNVADIVVTAEIADFVELNYDKAGRTNLAVEILPIDRLETGNVEIEEKTDTVASMRLDNIVASAFGLSRAKAADAIRGGIVSLNSVEATKVDMEVSEMDKIVLRGKGKVILAEVGGTSRKGRTYVKFNLYK